MQAFGRPRTAAILPFAAIAVSVALFLLIAVSVAFQPPTDARAGGSADVFAWLRTVSFVAAAFAFVVCIATLARPRDASAMAPDDGEDADEEYVEHRSTDTHAEEPAQRGTAMRYTLIALGAGEEDARAIADFDDANELVVALRAWRRRYPDEELRVFGPQGQPIAHRRSAWQPAARPAIAGTRARAAGLALGSA